jgi:hypothetical protein
MCIKICKACTQLDSVLNIINYLQEILLITSLYSPRLLNSVCWDKNLILKRFRLQPLRTRLVPQQLRIQYT